MSDQIVARMAFLRRSLAGLRPDRFPADDGQLAEEGLVLQRRR